MRTKKEFFYAVSLAGGMVYWGVLALLPPFFYWEGGGKSQVAGVILMLLAGLLVGGYLLFRLVPLAGSLAAPGLTERWNDRSRVFFVGTAAALAAAFFFGFLLRSPWWFLLAVGTALFLEQFGRFLRLPETDRSLRTMGFSLLALLLPVLLPVGSYWGVAAAAKARLARLTRQQESFLTVHRQRLEAAARFHELPETAPNAAKSYAAAQETDCDLPVELSIYEEEKPVRNPPLNTLRGWTRRNWKYFRSLDAAGRINGARMRQGEREETISNPEAFFRKSLRMMGVRQLAEPTRFAFHWLGSDNLVRHAESVGGEDSFLLAMDLEMTRLEQLRNAVLTVGFPNAADLRRILQQLEREEKWFSGALKHDFARQTALQLERIPRKAPEASGAIDRLREVFLPERDRLFRVASASGCLALGDLADSASAGDWPVSAPVWKKFRTEREALPRGAGSSSVVAGMERLELRARKYYALMAQFRCARMALALELYRERFRKYPPAAANLAPRVLDRVPDNPYTGNPLEWKTEKREMLFLDPLRGKEEPQKESIQLLTVTAPGAPDGANPEFVVPLRGVKP